MFLAFFTMFFVVFFTSAFSILVPETEKLVTWNLRQAVNELLSIKYPSFFSKNKINLLETSFFNSPTFQRIF